MKRCIALLSFVLTTLVSAQFCNAQSFENQSASIAAAFNAKNATALSAYFCNSVELVLPGLDDTYPKVQARNHVADFLPNSQLNLLRFSIRDLVPMFPLLWGNLLQLLLLSG